MDISKLHFFDNNGYNLNFEWNEDLGYWHGAIYLPKVSVGLYANISIYVLEEVGDQFVFPMAGGNSDSDGDNNKPEVITFEWDIVNTFVDEFFMFNFDETYSLQETSSLVYTPNDGPDCNTLIVNRFDTYEVPLEADYISKALPIHVAFMASEKYDATTYNRTLVMSYKGKTIARITYFAETVEEDERLKIWNDNLGYKITPEDEMIFYKSDIKEYRPDYQLLNEKRKELMMEGSNIYPYIGSYKAIINAIKFFGYENLNIIEYWKNVNPDDVNFGKIYHSSKYSLNHKETLRIGTSNIVLPNKDYKKINALALVYSINQPTEEKDELELPLVREKFTYSIEEAMVKLIALRKKLNKDFMPGTSRIIDIIGEANYFGIQGLVKVSDKAAIKKYEKDYRVDFETYPDKFIHITDNNEFNNFIIKPAGSDPESIPNPLKELSNTEKCEYFENYYDTLFVKYMTDLYTYVDQEYEYDDPAKDRYTAKTVLKVISEDITFEDCDLRFDCKVNNYKSDNSIDFSNPETVNATFETIDTVHYPQTISWVITMSNNQIDDELKNVGIQKSYVKKEDFKYEVLNKPLSEYKQVFVELPYVGYYDVTMILGEYSDSDSDESKMKSITKTKCIKVEPYQLSLIGFYYDARELPNHLKYDMDEDMAEFIQDNIDRMYYLALEERKNKDLDIDFTIPYKENGHYVVKGPYYTDKLDNEWYLSDNLTYEITKLVPITKYTRYIKNGVDVKPYTWFLLGYDYSKTVGTKNPKWTITNNITGEIKSYNGNYLTLLLRKVGNYTVDLTLKDENGNTYEISRNIVVVNKKANYDLYQSFKKDYDFIMSQELTETIES